MTDTNNQENDIQVQYESVNLIFPELNELKSRITNSTQHTVLHSEDSESDSKSSNHSHSHSHCHTITGGVQVLTSSGVFASLDGCDWNVLQSGMIVRCLTRDVIPADMLLLRSGNLSDSETHSDCQSGTVTVTAADCAVVSTDGDSACYLQYDAFDGSQRIRMRSDIPVANAITTHILMDIAATASDSATATSSDSASATATGKPSLRLSKVVEPPFHMLPIAGIECGTLPTQDRKIVHVRLLRHSEHDNHDTPQYIDLEKKNVAYAMGRVLLTECVIGVCLYTGQQTKYALMGGKAGAAKAKLEREAKEKKEKEERDKERARKEAQRKAAIPSVSTRIANFEAATHMHWRDDFMDVPDDGNCLFSAILIGLQTMLKYYPEAHVDSDSKLPADSHEFRSRMFELMRQDEAYVGVIASMLQFYVEGIEEAYLLSMEDFFVLPEAVREQIMMLKSLLYTEQSDGAAIQYDGLVATYLECVSSSKVINGRKVYVPCGEHELRAVARVCNVELQIASSESVLESFGAITLHGVDPRAIMRDTISIFSPGSSASEPGDSDSSSSEKPKRMVRLLHVKKNHYMVHVPMDPNKSLEDEYSFKGDVDPQYNDRLFWTGTSYAQHILDDLEDDEDLL
jgi:hypothetical protein